MVRGPLPPSVVRLFRAALESDGWVFLGAGEDPALPRAWGQWLRLGMAYGGQSSRKEEEF